MKKLAFLFVAVSAISFASCGNGTKSNQGADSCCDSTCCDSVDTVTVDSVTADSAVTVDSVTAQ